jgi:hypothetical protein
MVQECSNKTSSSNSPWYSLLCTPWYINSSSDCSNHSGWRTPIALWSSPSSTPKMPMTCNTTWGITLDGQGRQHLCLLTLLIMLSNILLCQPRLHILYLNSLHDAFYYKGLSSPTSPSVNSMVPLPVPWCKSIFQDLNPIHVLLSWHSGSTFQLTIKTKIVQAIKQQEHQIQTPSMYANQHHIYQEQTAGRGVDGSSCCMFQKRGEEPTEAPSPFWRKNHARIKS